MNALVLKTSVRVSVPGVRIPPSPPYYGDRRQKDPIGAERYKLRKAREYLKTDEIALTDAKALAEDFYEDPIVGTPIMRTCEYTWE